MEASIREGYENGDYFTDKIMEADLGNEMAFSSVDQVKDCSENIHNSDVQVTGYQVESSNESSVVFIESGDIVHSLPDSYEVVEVQGSSEEESVAKGDTLNVENNMPITDSNELEFIHEHVAQTTENLGNDYVVEHAHVESIDIPEEQSECQGNSSETNQDRTQNNSNIEDVIQTNPSIESDDKLQNTGLEEVPRESETVTDREASSAEVIHDSTEEEVQEIGMKQETAPEVVKNVVETADANVNNEERETSEQDSPSQYDENISNANSVETPEVNESAEMSSLHLSEVSGDNLVIEEDVETIRIIEESSNDEKVDPTDINAIKKNQEQHVVHESENKAAEMYYEQSYHETTTLENTYVMEESSQVSVQDVMEGPSTNVIEVEYEPKTDIATVVEEGQPKFEESKEQTDTEPSNIEGTPDTAVKRVRKTRKPICDMPMHVIGTNIAKPLENVPNGKSVPKPRLGVKVPYRNLTSQMVSKAEIEQEVLERSRQKEAASKGQAMFARSLTQRLARKLAPPNEDKDVKINLPKENREEPKEKITNTTSSLLSEDANTPIKDDSDLLAILEGDGEDIPILTPEVKPTESPSNVKMIEKEIALQQLQELPNQAPTPRTYKSRHAKTNLKLQSMPKEEVNSAVQHQPSNDIEEAKTLKDPLALDAEISQTTLSKKEINIVEQSPKKQPVEIEPQVKVNMVLKTYSRKRNISEVQGSPVETPPKKPAVNENVQPSVIEAPVNVYMTKSSRVIKKKVIWDPDESPSRSPRPVLKSPDTALKLSKPVNKNVNVDKVEKVVKPVDKKVTEKVEKTVKPLEKKTVEKISPVKLAKKKISPKVNKTPAKKPLTEVERLLMDEGAVKMLYDLKNTDDNAPKKKKDFFSVDKAHKDIIKKANQLKNDLVEQTTSTESPKSLRKKDGPSPAKPVAITQERKMSKDSIRSSVHTPPGSPFAHSQASMLIRRRSSSSISSSDELDSDAARPLRRRSDVPRPKRFKKSSEDSKSDVAVKVDVAEKPDETNPYKSFTIKKNSKNIVIELNNVNGNLFTFEVLDELTVALDKFNKDKEVSVVSITSCAETFCSGLDYSYLIANKEEERKEKAKKLSKKVKEFLLCLLHFPKVLIAGIQGECVGIGVTMLPLFDLVIASDAALFSTPFAHLGSFGEGSCLLNAPYVTAHGLATELLYTGQKLTADDALRRGLVSKLCWPEKYKDTVKSVVNSISKGSKQCLLSTKSHLRSSMTKQIEAAINSETNILIEHWTSAECQKNFGDLFKN